jgi:predicted ATPase/DNA-binding CsgD family transcriptional regulator/transcriptional regulator with XRE-family HTH domain
MPDMVEQPALGFGGLLRQLRDEAQLTQEELAEAARLSPRSVSDLERGIHRTAHKDTAVLLASALGLAEPARSLFVAAARGRGPAVQVLAARQRQAWDDSFASSGGMHGFVPALTSFAGRAGSVSEVAALLDQNRLVTVTGPGGAGKTRLAGEVARRVAGRFANGVWLAELAATHDPALLTTTVAAALGVQEQPGMPAAEVLARVLARRQLLLVLDNCEHVIGAAAELCAGLLATCDDLWVLATSREPLRVAGEVRYRLGPLALPNLDDLAGLYGSEAVRLFADRARQVDARFTLDDQTGPAVARLVRRLDGMPLAIELAAAQVEALGVVPLLDRLDDRFGLLTTGDRVAASRQQSLAATVEWSYRLLDEREQRVFRQVSAFPAGFTLEAAEAVAGPAAGPPVLRLVDCSLLSPPRADPDGRFRYVMLETLRAYGTGLLAGAGEQDAAAAALAGYALRVAEQAAARLQTVEGELAAARWLDAEDATMRQVLAWAMNHDAAMALRLAVALGWWWFLRGRLMSQYPLLREATGRTEPGSDEWYAAQFWLGYTALISADTAAALNHYTALRDAAADWGPCRALADGLGGRSKALFNMGQIAEAAEEARCSLAVAQEIRYPAGEAMALGTIGFAAVEAGDLDGALKAARQARQITAGISDSIARWSGYVLTGVLIEAGDLVAAEPVCAAALAQSRDAGDLWNLVGLLPMMVTLDLQAGRIQDAAAHLRESLQLIMSTGYSLELCNTLDRCGLLCAATGRSAEAVTVWAAFTALKRHEKILDGPTEVRRRDEPLRHARQVLGPARARAAEERGAAMNLDTAAEYALMLTAPSPPPTAAGPGRLSTRELELVTLVARGRTDAQIAAQLFISVPTVRSHLDQIRDKTGCRRRSDLTRLALTAGLV